MTHALEAPPRRRPDLTGGPNEPWISREAIKRLDELLTPEMTAIEWGSGAGTVWYAARVKELHTFEHREEGFFLYDVPSTSEGPEEYAGVDGRYYEDYSSAPGAPDKADAIFVDGRARSACLRTAVQKLKPGGVLVLDDARRTRYDLSIVPATWAVEEHYNEVYATKVWVAD